MAFNTNKTDKNKNQFTARLMSRKAEAMLTWINIPDALARNVFGVRTIEEITFKQAKDKLPGIFDNERSYVVVSDPSAEIEIVDTKEY